MKVILNKQPISIDEAATLDVALKAASIEPKGIAVAVNEKVVPKNEYATHELHEGDEIIIIKAFYGG